MGLWPDLCLIMALDLFKASGCLFYVPHQGLLAASRPFGIKGLWGYTSLMGLWACRCGSNYASGAIFKALEV
jgi:hypothetical protein